VADCKEAAENANEVLSKIQGPMAIILGEDLNQILRTVRTTRAKLCRRVKQIRAEFQKSATSGKLTELKVQASGSDGGWWGSITAYNLSLDLEKEPG
jgi:hypothetical protein